jgi:hypothetical protein
VLAPLNLGPVYGLGVVLRLEVYLVLLVGSNLIRVVERDSLILPGFEALKRELDLSFRGVCEGCLRLSVTSYFCYRTGLIIYKTPYFQLSIFSGVFFAEIGATKIS